MALLMLTVSNVQAQKVKETTDSVKAAVKSGNVKDAYSKVSGALKSKSANVKELIGTWIYKEPAVYATKGNLLVKAAGNAVSSELEKLVQDYIEKSNITSANTQVTFRQDGRFDRVLSGQKAHGVWLVNGEKLYLGIDNVLTAEVTVHHDDKGLMLLMDVDKLLDELKTLGAMKDTKTNKRLIKLSKSIPGLQAGFLVVKKQ